MLKKNETKILELFSRNLFLEESMLSITKRINKKSYQRVYDSIGNLQKAGILKISKKGNIKLVSLDINYKSISYLSFLKENNLINKTIPNYENIMSIPELSNYLVIITGSYAKGTFTQKSDIDMVVVIPDYEKAIDIQKKIENLLYLYHPQFHIYVFNNKDFLEMLLIKKENYGKEIFKNNLILKNARIYYELIKEAISHGFRG